MSLQKRTPLPRTPKRQGGDVEGASAWQKAPAKCNPLREPAEDLSAWERPEFGPESSNDSWGVASTHSDDGDYISQKVIKSIHKMVNDLHHKSLIKEVLFTPTRRINLTRYSIKAHRAAMLHTFTRNKNLVTCVKLVRYYNQHGYLCAKSQYKLLDLAYKTKGSLLMRRLRKSDVGNIREERYNDPILLKIAEKVRDRELQRSVRIKLACKQHSDKYKLCKNIMDSVNPFRILPVETGWRIPAEEAEEALDDVPSTSKASRSRPNLRFLENENYLPDSVVYRNTVIPIRDPGLLEKLHIIIRNFMNARKKKIYRDEIEMVPLRSATPMEIPEEVVSAVQCVQPEMMEPEPVSQQQEAGPVVLNIIEQDKQIAATENDNDGFWTNNSTGDVIVNQQHASSMEILLAQFQWNSTQAANTKIFDIELPNTAVAQNPTHPAAMLFNQYAYWNGDIKIRIHINTTPFHIGKLIFSWYYASAFDANSHHRDNIASSVLLPHVNFNASEGNDVVLEIPYKNYRSMLCTRSDLAVDYKALYLGNLRCHVFNPLLLSGSTVVDGYVHVSFVNNQFTGISPRIQVQPEMLPTRSMIKTVEGALNIVDAISNMDKPSNPAVPKMYTPQLTDSFASGVNDVNNIHMLRLDPLGQTPHPSGSTTRKHETLIKDIIQKPGLIKTLLWKTTSSRGYKLYQLDVSPELNYTDYYPVHLKSDNRDYTAVVLPPVSAISTINAYNRGSIKYTIEVICSRFHAGALLVSYTPRSKNVDINTAIQSYNSTLDIGNVKSYDFIVPYINERPYNPRFNRESSSVVLPQLVPTGEFNIFVLNELRTVNDISDTVYINVFMSAGTDFEVAVPAPPMYSVNYDYVLPYHPNAKYMAEMSGATGLDTWRYFDKDSNLVVFKYESFNDSIAQMNDGQFYTVYKLQPRSGKTLQDKPYIVSRWYKNSNGVVSRSTDFSFNAQYFALFIVNNDGNKYKYMIPFYSLATANSYCRVHKALSSADKPYPNSPSIAEWARLDPSAVDFYLALSNSGSASYRDTSSRDVTDYPFVAISNYRVIPEMDNIVVDPTLGLLPSTLNGLRLYGERFQDLKDYGRRYQLYGSATVQTNKDTLGFRVRVPITPIGLGMNQEANGKLHSITREGMIGYIMSAYRFYRGSLRFKLIITIHKNQGGPKTNQFDTIYVQHKPDLMLNTRDITTHMITGVNSTPSDVLQSGYAYTAFSPHINNSITFEIPCYIPTNLLMLQKPNFDALAETLHYTLGCFDILGYTNNDGVEYELTLHYSIADDMDVSCYVGFPPMVPMYTLPTISETSFEMVQPEMDKPTTSRKAKEDGDKPEAQGIFSRVKSKLTKVGIDNALKNIREQYELEEREDDAIHYLIGDLTAKLGKEYIGVITPIITSALNCIIHPDVSSFVLAIVNLIGLFGINAFKYISKFTKTLKDYFRDTEPQMDDDKTERSSEDALRQSFTMAIVDMGIKYFGKTWDWVKQFKMPNFSKGIFNEIRAGALTVNTCIIMIRNLVDVLPKIWEWLGKIVNPVKWYRWFFASRKEFILKWVSDVEWFVDPKNLEAVKSNMKYAYQAEILIIVGRDINLKMSRAKAENYDTRYITSLNTRMNQIYQIIVSNFKSISGIGVEPYAFRIVGDSQCGKSYISTELIYHCLGKIGYKSNGNLVYTRPKTNHFDGLTGVEAAIYYDDFLHLTTDAMASEQIGEILTLKSKCLFVPPRASVEDKGKAFNPLILAATMNEEYPDFSSICGNRYAWQNRFDDMIRAEFVAPPDYPDATNCNDLPYDELRKFSHCRFKIYKYRNNNEDHPNAHKEFKVVSVPTFNDEGVQGCITKCTTLTFEQLKWYISERFSEQMDVITQECMRDLKRVKEFQLDSEASFEVNIDSYIEYVKQDAIRRNAKQVNKLNSIKQALSDKPCETCKQPLTLCPCKILNTPVIGQLNVQAEGVDALEIVIRDRFKSMPDHVLDYANMYHVLDYYKTVRNFGHNDQVNATIHSFLSKPCIHKYWAMVQIRADFDIDRDGDDLYVRTPSFQLISLNDTECCRAITKCRITKKYVYGIVKSQYPGQPVPAWLHEDAPFIDKAAKNYYDEMALRREKFRAYLGFAINRDIFLGTGIGKVFKIIYTISKILAVVGAIYGICNIKSFVTDKLKRRHDAIKAMNVSYAKMLEEHVVTDDCANGECIMCIKPQMAYDENKLQHRRVRHKVVAKEIASSVPAQAEMASEAFNSLNRHLQRNYFLMIGEKDGLEVQARCLGLTGNWFLAVDHYFDKFIHMGRDANYYYCDVEQRKSLNFADIKVFKLKNSALVMCKLPRHFPSFKNIVKYFISQNHVYNTSSKVILYQPHIDPMMKDRSMNVMMNRDNVVLVDDTLHIPDINGKEDRYTTCEWYWEYATSGKGLCGSVLISDSNITAPLIGIHVAGRPGGGCGYSELVCMETLTSALETLDPERPICDVEIEGQMFNDQMIHMMGGNEKEMQAAAAILEGDYAIVGVVPNKFAHNSPSTSRLRHTICYNGITKSTYDFPHLSNNDKRFEGSPMVAGCMHHTNPPKVFPSEIVDVAHDDIRNLVLAKVKPVRSQIGVLSLEESICGIHKIKQYGAMEMDTSEGFPFVSMRPRGAKDKKWLFDLAETEEGYALLDIKQCLIDVMQRKHKQRTQGIVPITVFTDCLKDAKLPKEKCNKTRIFSISPVDFTIQFRQYFYDFTIAFQEARFNIESAVGINVDSLEWNVMVTRLLANSKKFVCGDYSKFGPRLMSDVVIRFFEIICDWYDYNGDTSILNRRIRMIMAHEVAFAHHLMFNLVYQVYCGAPSGCPITTILNNGVNMFYLRTAFISLAREHRTEYSVSDFQKHITVFFYGDDLIMTVKDDVLQWFNAQNLSLFFNRYDIKFTDALKTGSMNLYTTVFAPETSFLKRTIKRHVSRNVFCAAMDTRAIEETCNWMYNSVDHEESSLIACESMLLNAHGHGPFYYGSLRTRVLDWWRCIGKVPRIPLWSEVDWRIYDKDDFIAPDIIDDITPALTNEP